MSETTIDIPPSTQNDIASPTQNDIASPTQNENMQRQRKLIQKQLIFLLHATRCQQDCSFRGCVTFKCVVAHLRSCHAQSCQSTYCESSKRILNHWRQCRLASCQVCQPMKNAAVSNWQATGLELQRNTTTRPDARLRGHPYASARSRDAPLTSLPATSAPPTPTATSNPSIPPTVLYQELLGTRRSAVGPVKHKSRAATICRLMNSIGARIATPTEADEAETPVFETSEEELEHLKKKTECPVCWTGHKNVVFQCGHQSCFGCAKMLEKCHSCRAEIVLKIKLF